jgi:hypothetical protein
MLLRLLSYHVFSDPKILHGLLPELYSAGTSELGTIELRKTEQLPFLTAVSMEGLRLSPGVATRMARIAPDRDLSYRDWRIPAGMPVGMTTILMRTDENSYPDPYPFRPERWLDGSGGRKNVDNAYAPFSRGSRMCVGMQQVFSLHVDLDGSNQKDDSLAWAEVYPTLAALVQQFTFQFLGAKAEDFQCASDQFIYWYQRQRCLDGLGDNV